jgi:DNA repair photolyase
MKNRVVEVRSIRNPIMRSPGFEKKELSEYKLDLMGLCGFGCRYCSSNWGNYLRINRQEFADLTEAQLGERLLPSDEPSITFHWPDVLDNLRRQLAGKHKSWGAGKTLVFSMLTDGFSPLLVKQGTTEEALRLVLEHTGFRIRVLTKNAIVGSPKWIDFFRSYPGRFVVGLSVGTLDADWSRKIEVGASLPQARLRALRSLQDAGVPTFGMLCPVFPDVLANGSIEELLSAIRPAHCEHVWAEPYNDRQNWNVVRSGYAPGSDGHSWLTSVYGNKRRDVWSRYATDLYLQLRGRAEREGWLSQLRYLLYEKGIVEDDAGRMGDLRGVLLQSSLGEHGRSRNPHIAAQQRTIVVSGGVL